MIGASLFGVLVLAKVLALTGRDLPLAPWSALAFVWQDALLAAAFTIAENDNRIWRRVLWSLYAAIVALAAFNVPLARATGSMLTWTMAQAAGAPLADSIRVHATGANLARIAVVMGSAFALPMLLRRRRFRAGWRTAAIAAAIVAAGYASASQVETFGFDRSVVVALFGAVRPDAAGVASVDEWRVSPFPSQGPVEDLSLLRGAARGRNVVMIALESMAAQYVGLYGAREDPAPNLTALARDGIVFENAYVIYPESVKGFFSTLCSRYPAFEMPAATLAAGPCASLAASFSRAGYRTALFHSGRFMYLGMQEVIAGRGFDVLEDAGAIGGNVESSFGVDEPAAVNRMLVWIDGLPRGQRFFLTYLPIAGHHPYATLQRGPFDDGTEVGRYRNALREGDAALGMLMDGLRARHLDRETLIVAYGDHGEAFGQHAGNIGHTLFIYDENVRVPLVIASPGLLERPLSVSRASSTLDLAPTILDLVGLDAMRAHEGASLLGPTRRMAFFFTDYSLGWLGLRDGCFKFVYETNADRSKLFDVCEDPGETKDLSAREPARVTGYRSRVTQWVARQAPRR